MKSVRMSQLLQRVLQDLYLLRIALPVLLLYGILAWLVFHTVCPFAILTGFACPSCGMTRAVLLFLFGQFRLSFSMHPMALFWPLLLLYAGYFRYFRDRQAPFALAFTVVLSLATLACYFCRLTAGTLPRVPCPGILCLAISISP